MPKLVRIAGASEWARNVLGAGHCRMQLHDTIHCLDVPVLVAAGERQDVATPTSRR